MVAGGTGDKGNLPNTAKPEKARNPPSLFHQLPKRRVGGAAQGRPQPLQGFVSRWEEEEAGQTWLPLGMGGGHRPGSLWAWGVGRHTLPLPLPPEPQRVPAAP